MSDDPFNCSRCGAHDYGLFASHMLPCIHCVMKDRSDLLSALKQMLTIGQPEGLREMALSAIARATDVSQR